MHPNNEIIAKIWKTSSLQGIAIEALARYWNYLNEAPHKELTTEQAYHHAELTSLWDELKVTPIIDNDGGFQGFINA